MTLYQLLRERELRLIKVKPGPSASPLECELKVFLQGPVRGQSPAYIALSYTWGIPSDTVSIRINGQVFSITRNLHHALLQIREWSADTNELYSRLNAPYWPLQYDERFRNIFGHQEPGPWFWVDAICINQMDLVEKSRLVPQMEKIYSDAMRVLCWLGPMGDILTDFAINMLFSTCIDIQHHMNAREEGVADRAWLSQYQLGDKLGGAFDAFEGILVYILKRPYFSRVWTIQEAVLSPTEPMFAVGRFTVPGQSLWYTLWALEMADQEIPHGVLLRSLAVNALTELRSRESERVYSQIFLSSEGSTPGQNPGVSSESVGTSDQLASLAKTLDQILNYTTVNYKCSVPHDMIYGILSLAHKSNFPKELAPDYNLPHTKVYWEYFCFIAKHTGNLNLLSSYRKDLQGVPSWVPDFRYRNASLELPTEFTQIRFSPDGQKMMNVEGVEYGRIVGTHALLPGKRYTAKQQFLRLGGLAIKSFTLCELPESQALQELIASFGFTYVNEGGGQAQIANIIAAQAVGVDASIITDVAGPPLEDAAVDEVESDVLRERVIQAAAEVEVEQPFCPGQITHVLSEKGVIAQVRRRDIAIKRTDVLCVLKGSSEAFILRPSNNGGCEVVSACSPRTVIKPPYDRMFFATNVVKRFELI